MRNLLNDFWNKSLVNEKEAVQLGYIITAIIMIGIMSVGMGIGKLLGLAD
jgi:hypothetical protein